MENKPIWNSILYKFAYSFFFSKKKYHNVSGDLLIYKFDSYTNVYHTVAPSYEQQSQCHLVIDMYPVLLRIYKLKRILLYEFGLLTLCKDDCALKYN